MVFWGPNLVEGKLLLGYDMIVAGTPVLQFESQTLLDGELPLWNPYLFSGRPSSIYLSYPLHWPFLLSPTPFTLEFLGLFTVFLLGMTMYGFAREIGLTAFASAVCALIFTFSEHTFARLWAGHLAIIEVQLALPLLFLAIVRLGKNVNIPNIALGAVAVAVLLFPGFPQSSYIGLLAGGLFGLFVLVYEVAGLKRISLILASLAMILGGVALYAGQLLPSIEVLSHSTRGAGITFDFATEGSFPPWYLVTLFSPDFFGSPPNVTLDGLTDLGVTMHEGPAYIGAVAVMLSLFGIWSGHRDRKVIFFTFLGVLFLIISMGKYTPLYRLLFDYVPGYNLFRISSRHLFIVVFCFSLLAAWGAQNLWQQRENAVVTYKVALAMLLAFEAFVAAGYVFRGPALEALNNGLYWHLTPNLLADSAPNTPNPTPLLPELYNGAIFSFWLPTLVMVVFCLWYFLFHKRTLADWQRKSVLALLILGGLLAYDVRLTNANMRYYEPTISRLSTFNNIPITGIGKWRTLLLEGDFTAETARNIDAFSLVEGIEVVNGYDPVVLADYARYLQLITGTDEIMNTAQIFTNIARPELLDLLSAKSIIAGTQIPADLSERWNLLGHEEGIWLYQNKYARPRAYLVDSSSAILVPDRDSAFEILRSGLDPALSIIETSAGAQVITVEEDFPMGTSPGIVSIDEYKSNYIRLSVETSSACYLVLNDIFFSGWNAVVDGQRQDILRANAILRSVPLGPGVHTIEFRLVPSSFFAGAGITGTSIVSFLILGVYHYRFRQRRARPGPPVP